MKTGLLRCWVAACSVVRGLWLPAILFFLVAAPAAQAAITTWYDPNGGIVERLYEGSVGGKPWAYTTSNGEWYRPTGPGNAAGVRVGRDVTIDATKGANVAGKLRVFAASEITAAELAAGSVRFLRGGVAAVAVGYALDIALKNAHLGFDKLQQSMVYNPDPIPGGGGPGCQYEYQYRGHTRAAWSCNPVDALNAGFSNPGPNANAQTVSSCTFIDPVTVSCRGTYLDDTPPPAARKLVNFMANFDLDARVPPTGGGSTGPSCPNGVEFNDTTKCRELVGDGRAGDLFTPYLGPDNGPAIGQNVMGGNGQLMQPDTGLTPSVTGNHLNVDPNVWPQMSGPESQTQGPVSSSQTSTTSGTGVDGTPYSSTTTTTITNTTNLLNTYNNSTSVTNIINTTRTQVCDAAGVCTNKTDSSSPPGTQGEEDKPKPCGLPGTPKCLIDETGTPDVATGVAGLKPGSDALDAARDTQIDMGTSAVDGSSKDTRWKFSFAFPTNCSPLNPWEGVTLDICRFQPMIHDLMSMVWYGSTFFAVLWMFGKTIRGGE